MWRQKIDLHFQNKDVISFFQKKKKTVLEKHQSDRKNSFVPSGIKNIEIAMKKTDKNAFGNLKK